MFLAFFTENSYCISHFDHLFIFKIIEVQFVIHFMDLKPVLVF